MRRGAAWGVLVAIALLLIAPAMARACDPSTGEGCGGMNNNPPARQPRRRSNPPPSESDQPQIPVDYFTPVTNTGVEKANTGGVTRRPAPAPNAVDFAPGLPTDAPAAAEPTMTPSGADPPPPGPSALQPPKDPPYPISPEMGSALALVAAVALPLLTLGLVNATAAALPAWLVGSAIADMFATVMMGLGIGSIVGLIMVAASLSLLAGAVVLLGGTNPDLSGPVSTTPRG